MELIFLLLSAVPGIEARGSSIYFLCSQNYAFIPLTVMINFIAILVFIRLLEMARVPRRVERFLERRAKKRVDFIEKLFEKYGNMAIFLLIALPSTGVGSFTGAFIGKVFELKGRLFYVSILLAIIFSLLPSLLIAYGINIIGIRC